MIDGLDSAAFENLLTRVPEDQRERFATLVESSRDPKRKLRLWREFHKSKATNDLAKYKGDFGNEDDRTDAQQAALARFERREQGVDWAKDEADEEMARLMELDKQGKLTVADVDKMRARKDLELQIEMQHNVSLTADSAPRDDGSRVEWSKPELQQVQASLAQLPAAHLESSKMVEQIHRSKSQLLGPQGQYHGKHITIHDGANNGPTDIDKHRRTNVSDDVRQNHGDEVGWLEYALTHEIGHDAERDHPKAFEKFKKAGGWETLSNPSELSTRDRNVLERRRGGFSTEEHVGDVTTNGKDYVPAGDRKSEYHRVDDGVIPDGDPQWKYAKTNAQEHFAEVYAKAVHAPELLYQNMVADPAAAVREARDAVARKQRELEQATNATEREAVETELAKLEGERAAAEKMEKQRSAQFGIMRNDVFGTDKATNAALDRMRASKASPEKLRAFQERAAKLSTPAQIDSLEKELGR